LTPLLLLPPPAPKKGGSFKIITHCGQKKIEGWISEGVLAESTDAVEEKIGQEKLELLLRWLDNDYFKITPFPKEENLQKFKEIDRKDRHILVSAEAAKVDFLISLDRKHILTEKAQKAIPKIKIVTPKEFLQKHFK